MTREQRRLVETMRSTAFEFGALTRSRDEFAGGMQWLKVKKWEYLTRYRRDPVTGEQKSASVGRRSPDTEAIYDRFIKERGELDRQIEALRPTMAEQARMARALRLTRALKAVKPASARDFLNLAAVQIRRELTDLARHEFGPEGPGKKHATEPPVQGAAEDQPGEWVDRAKPRKRPEPGPETEARWRDILRYVDDTFPEEEREVFDLVYYQGLSPTDAAQLLEVSARTVKRRWQAACLQLHEALGGRLPGM